MHAAHRKPSLNAGSFPISEFGEAPLRLEAVPAEELIMGKGGGNTCQRDGLRSPPGNAEIAPTRVSFGGTLRPKSCIWLKD